MHKKITTILVAIGALAVAGSAVAAAEHSALIPRGAPSNYLAIDSKTCKFIHPEIDVKPTPLERYARAEDSRDDVKLSCLTRKLNHQTVSKARLDYKTAYATGTSLRVTATCPAGYFVTGGGSHSETAGSYEEGNDAWTVVRDHLSPATLDVTATCIRFVP